MARNWNLCECCEQELPLDQRKALYDPTCDTEAECKCGHPYYRHFDSYNDMEPVGCKYCECRTFEGKPNG